MNDNTRISKTLMGLLKNYSPTGDEGAASTFLVQRMQELNFDQAFIDEAGNPIGVYGEGERTLILLGHIDTVPGFITPKIEKGMIFGRGAVDAKASLSAFVDSISAIKKPENGKIIVIGAVEEEGGSKGAKHIVDQYGPDYVVIGEPSSWDRITLGYKGSVRVKINFETEKSHPAHNSINAVERVVNSWFEILEIAKEFNKDKTKIFSKLTPKLYSIQTEDADFFTKSEMKVECRIPPEFEVTEWLKVVREIVGESGVVSIMGTPVDAYSGSKSNRMVSAFLGSIRALDGNPRFVYKTGTSDMNIVGPAWSCPVIAYGPGDSSLDHTPNEHLSLDEYDRSVKVLTYALEKIFS